MSGPKPPGPESFGDEPGREPIADENTHDVTTDTGFSQAAVTFHLALDDRYKPGPPQSAFVKDFIARLHPAAA